MAETKGFDAGETYHGAVSAEAARNQAEAVFSVKPRHIEDIAFSSKTWEVRRKPPNDRLEWVALYATQPSAEYRDKRETVVEKVPGQKVVELVKFGGSMTASAEDIWEVAGGTLGMTRDELEEYLGDERGKAFHIVHSLKIHGPDGQYGVPLKFFDVDSAPQNFQYLNNDDEGGDK